MSVECLKSEDSAQGRWKRPEEPELITLETKAVNVEGTRVPRA